MRQAALMVAVDRRAIGGLDGRLEGADLGKQPLFSSPILRIREAGVEIGRVDVFKADAMPCLEFREPPAGLAGSADDHSRQRQDRREADSPHPAREPSHDESLRAGKVRALSHFLGFFDPVAIRRTFAEFFTERGFPLKLV